MSSRMKIFLDANVIFSAANESGNLSRLLMRLAMDHTLVTSDYAHQEAYRNILAKRPQWEQGYQAIIANLTIVSGIDKMTPVPIASKDRPILATAIAEQCDILLTGDKRDFGHLFNQTIGTVTVLTPLMFAQKYF